MRSHSSTLAVLLIFLALNDISLCTHHKSFLRHHHLGQDDSPSSSPLTEISMSRKSFSDSYKQKRSQFVQESQKVAMNPAKTMEMVTISSTSQLADMRKLHLNNYDSTEFTASFGVGTPPQFMDVILDTGSSNIWIDSTLCDDYGCKAHTQYDHDQSSTFKADGKQVSVMFGSGPLQGEVNYDDVTLGEIVIKGQSVGEITSEQIPVFDIGEFAGIVGLGFQALATEGTSTMLDNISSQKLVAKNMFTFYIPRTQTDNQRFLFGQEPSSDLFKGDLHWVDVMEEYYWTAKLTDIKVGDESLGLCSEDKPCSGVVDSGTSINTAPADHLMAILSKLDIDSCRSGSPMTRSLSYCFGEECFELAPEDYLMGQPETSCDVAIMSMSVNHNDMPLLILGDTFLMKYMVVFDKEKSRMGFAPYPDEE